jgi:hypothetical protein
MNVLTFSMLIFSDIKMDLQEIGWVGMDWIVLAHDRVSR